MKLLSLFSTVLLFASLCLAQEPITLDLDTDAGLTIEAPGEYNLAEYTFGSLPMKDGEPTQGLTVTLNADDGLIFYGPSIETGPGDVLVECTVWCTGPDVGLVLLAMNLPDHSMMANLLANGAKFTGGWNTMRLFCDPENDIIVPTFQAVSAGDGTTVVCVDQIISTPVDGLSDGEIVSLFRQTDTNITIDLPNPTLLEMVKIPAGTFTMGSPSDERGRYPREGPQHVVTLTQPFYLGKYEVTQAQWEAVMGMGSNPSRSGGKPNHPVEQVSWDDCQAFIEKLNGMGLGTFRLPTEAEWEYACRAGTDTRFSFGDALECSDSNSYCALMDEYVWWGGNRTYGEEQDGSKEVGRKLPNPWGLYDMHGNVFEWCSDRYGSYRSDPQVDPQGSASSMPGPRVVRGGYWGGYALYCRSALRIIDSPDYRFYHLGLRLVREYP